jgi:KipI family sensor histidine kinase inhibitor
MIVHDYGDRAVLVETDDPLGLLHSVLALPGVEEATPAAQTVLIRFDPTRFDRHSLSGLKPAPWTTTDVETVELRVDYDGPDLESVAAAAGCSVEEVVRRHTDAHYIVAFCGFAPGFAYLRGLHVSLRQPRLASPRTSVPAGAVGVAGEFTGVYPRASPGGWRLLGRTDADLWNLDRARPGLLSPGVRVRFTT